MALYNITFSACQPTAFTTVCVWPTAAPLQLQVSSGVGQPLT